MKCFITLLTLFLFLHSKTPAPFENIPCISTATPEYDERKVVSNNQEAFFRIKKTRNTFRPCRILIYNALYKEGEVVISNEKIWAMTTGKRWKFDSTMQDEIIVQYEHDPNKTNHLKKYLVNKTLDAYWQKKEITGIIENENEVWMHPFRSNQYYFTEVAPFPSVKLPLQVGKTWASSILIEDSWGDWNNSRISSHYMVKGIENSKTQFGEIKDYWRIVAKSVAPFGNSENQFWFNKDLGFVKMNYKNYKGQTLQLELAAVIEK